MVLRVYTRAIVGNGEHMVRFGFVMTYHDEPFWLIVVFNGIAYQVAEYLLQLYTDSIENGQVFLYLDGKFVTRR